MRSFQKTLFRKRLLRWYGKHRRDLPWRRTRDPYRIWLSEVMLQQTQVATVIPFYLRFLRRFPTLASLAKAEEEAVLALWSGLGYYRRAKLLHQGARTLQGDFQGKLPKDPEALRKIPGIGPYTAGAIASIAFQRPAPLVDGNVIRVFSRLFGLQGHAKSPGLKAKVWEEAKGLLDPESPGDFNQALMELGATICRVRMPACPRCPVEEFCRARRAGRPEDFPESPPPKKIISLQRVAALCRRGEKILLVKRREGRWFQGLWELPHDYPEDFRESHETLQAYLRETLGIELRSPRPLPPTRHHITHHRITTHAWMGEASGRLKPTREFLEGGFFPIKGLAKYPLSNFDRKVLVAAGLKSL